MARPAKPTTDRTGKVSKTENIIRQSIESSLLGNSDNLKPPDDLTENQKKIFLNVVKEREKSGTLGNLDVYLLSYTAICIDRLDEMEKEIEKDRSCLKQATFMASKSKYSADFFKCISELGMSPQARAKLSISGNQQEEKKNPLLSLIGDDEDD